MIEFMKLDPKVDLGLLPEFLDPNDPRPAKEQIDSNYSHGGGWRPLKGFEINSQNRIVYPGDPPLRPVAVAKLRKELIIVHEMDWVAIIQPDRSFEVARID